MLHGDNAQDFVPIWPSVRRWCEGITIKYPCLANIVLWASELRPQWSRFRFAGFEIAYVLFKAHI